MSFIRRRGSENRREMARRAKIGLTTRKTWRIGHDDGASACCTSGSGNYPLRHAFFAVGAVRKTQHRKGGSAPRVGAVGGRSRQEAAVDSVGRASSWGVGGAVEYSVPSTQYGVGRTEAGFLVCS
jgi:hypothetical protein